MQSGLCSPARRGKIGIPVASEGVETRDGVSAVPRHPRTTPLELQA